MRRPARISDRDPARGAVRATGPVALVGAMILPLILAAPSATFAQQQELTHPRAMELDDVAWKAPDPAPLRLQLDNGLTAYVVADNLVPLVRLTALIGAGDADAPGGAAYAAALRAGPAAMRPGRFEQALTAMAARYDVAPQHTETRVTLEVPSEDVTAAVSLFSSLLRDPLTGAPPAGSGSSASDEATGESGPVLYEGSMDVAVMLLERAVYAGHSYVGARDAEAPTDAPASAPVSARSFANRFVVPANVALAVSGDFNPAAMRADLTSAFADWSGEAPAMPAHPLPQRAARREVLTYNVDKLQGWVAIGHELPEVPTANEAALLVMNYILGGGHFDTRLFLATRDRRGLTNDDSGFPEQGFRGPGLYSFRTYGRPEVVRLLIHLTLQEIERIRTEPVTEEELFVARGALADGDTSLWFRNGAATATTYAREWLRYGDHTRTSTWRQRVHAVTADAVLAAAQRYLDPERMRIVVLGPLDAIRNAATLEDEQALEEYER